jgi:hypothetical protein
VAAGLPAGRLDGRGAAESGEGGVVTDPARVVARDQQQARGDLGSDAGLAEQSRRGAGGQLGEDRVELGDLLVEDLVASREGAERGAGRVDCVESVAATQPRAADHELLGGYGGERFA